MSRCLVASYGPGMAESFNRGASMKRFSCFLLATLCGAAGAQEQASSIGDCYSKMWQDGRAALVLKRIGVGQSPIPLELRSSKARANAKEKASLEFVATEMQSCQQRDEVNRKNFHPAIKRAVEEYEAEIRASLTRAYAGDVTWGGLIEANEANSSLLTKRIQEVKDSIAAEIQAEAKRYAEQQAANAIVEEQRQAAARAEYERRRQMQAQEEQARRAQEQQQFMNGLMMLDAARGRPAANPWANSFSCSSRNMNGSVQTNCW